VKKNIYLIDLTHETSAGLGSDMMPLQLGLIGAYCLKQHPDKQNIEIMKFTHELDKVIKENPPFILAASISMRPTFLPALPTITGMKNG